MANLILDALGGVVPLLEKLAPTIATAVGGPLAGTAVTFVEKAMGLERGAGPRAIAETLDAATPEQLAQLKKADSDFAVAMRQLDISIEKQDSDDRASARLREAAVRDYTPTVLAYALTLGLFGFVALLILVPNISDNAGRILNVILGSIATAWVAMVSYYYGSSRSSQSKDLLLFNSVPATSVR